MRIRLGMVAALAVAAIVWPASASAQTTHDPILFIHGFSENSSMWANFTGRFAADGWNPAQLYTMDYNSTQSNRTIAEQVNQRVDAIRAANGGAKVDLITHSMGGLNSRWYIKFLGGVDEVEDWVSLGGPNHGTKTAYGCFGFVSCREMVPGSAFLAELNAGDETPGDVRYGTWWSPCDEVIVPQESTILSGAQNTRTACMEHIQLSQDPRVYGEVRDFVR
jgi:triacylglycerol lipase